MPHHCSGNSTCGEGFFGETCERCANVNDEAANESASIDSIHNTQNQHLHSLFRGFTLLVSGLVTYGAHCLPCDTVPVTFIVLTSLAAIATLVAFLTTLSFNISIYTVFLS